MSPASSLRASVHALLGSVSACCALVASAQPLPDAIALHRAAREGNVSGLAEALAATPNAIDRPDAAGHTPLVLAAREGHEEAVSLLLARGARVDYASPDGTSVIIAALTPPATLDPANQPTPGAALDAAYDSLRDRPKQPQVTADLPATNTVSTAIRDELRRRFPMWPAPMRAAKARILEQLLAAGAPLPASSGSMPPLALAIASGGSELLLPLLRAGANAAQSLTPERDTLLHLAALAGNAAAVPVLVAHRADLEAMMTSPFPTPRSREPISGGQTPLMLALGVQNPDVARALLDAGARLEATNGTLNRPLHFAALAGDPRGVALLLDRGARPSPRDRWMCSPLNYAAALGRLEAVELLLARGADLETADDAGYTPLLDAIEKNHPAIVRLLVAKGARLDVRTRDIGKTPLRVAATTKNVELARFLIDECGQKAAGEPGDRQPPLIEAIGSGSIKVATLLLDRGADANTTEHLGYTGLHVAVVCRLSVQDAWRRSIGAVPVAAADSLYGPALAANDADYDALLELLLSRGARIDAPDRRNADTALHLAARFGAVSAVRLLLDRGASRTVANRANETPLAVALAARHAAIIELLGGDPSHAGRASTPSARQALTQRLVERFPAPSSRAAPAAQAVSRTLSQSARASLGRGELQQALTDFNRALELDPENADALAGRGSTRIVLRDQTNGLADLDRAVSLAPQDAFLLRQRGVAHGVLGRGDAALADLGRALELAPNDGQALLVRAELQRNLGRLDAAWTDYTAAIAALPHLAEPHLGRAVTLLRQRKWRDALPDFDRALELQPASVEALVGRGTARNSTGNFSGSVADHTRALELNPRHASAHYGRALARRALDDAAGSLADLDQALRLDPRLVAAHQARGIAQLAIGNATAARADFERFLQSNPTATYARLYHFLCLPAAERPAAEVALRSAVGKWTDTWPKPLALHLLGEIDAATLLARAAQQAPMAPARRCEAEYVLGMHALRLGRAADARAHFTQSITRRLPSVVAYTLAQAELRRLE